MAMTNGRSGLVYYESGDGVQSARGAISIEESTQVSVVRVRGDSETVIPWSRVVRIDYS